MSINLETTFQSISKKMLIDFEEITSQEGHPVLKGKMREIIVKNFLREYLPQRFGIGYGKVVSSNGDSSREQDIMIYDKDNCPIFYQTEDIQIVPSEEIYAVIQVKSKLDSNELINSIDNIRSVKELPKTAYYEQSSVLKRYVKLYGKTYEYFPTIGFLFAFDSINLDTLAQKLIEKNNELKLDYDKRIDLIYVLKKGLIINMMADGKQMICLPDSNTRIAHSETEQGLLIFYLMLMHILSQSWVRPIRLLNYPFTFNIPVIMDEK